MSETEQTPTVTIDGKAYALDKLSVNAEAQLANIRFVDEQIQQLNNELAIADTARIAYTRALKRELEKVKNAAGTEADAAS